MNKVFVYGTLRPGNPEKTRIIPGRIYNLGWYPGLVLDGSSPGVVVEEITVSDERLRALDQYEGYSPDRPESSLYLRVPFEDGFIYEYNGDMSSRNPVPGGDWLVYTGKSAGSNSQLTGEE